MDFHHEASNHGSGQSIEPDSTATIPVDKALASKKYRDLVIRELVETERRYVHGLTQLCDLKNVIEQHDLLSRDVVQEIFFSLDAVLKFCNTFLLKIEEMSLLQPEDTQRWGSLFATSEEAFGVYVPYIGNQRQAKAAARREFDKISQIDHPLAIDINTLEMFIMWPLPRLVKYPLLLKDLRDRTGANDEAQADLTSGIEAIDRVIEKFNAAIDLDLRNEALDYLYARLEDWKDLRFDSLGELVIFGTFPVLRGALKRQYKVYLFKRFLLFCVEDISPTSRDEPVSSQKPESRGKYQDTAVRLKLKGWISMRDKPRTLQLPEQGNDRIQIDWVENNSSKSVDILFPNDFMMKKWFRALDSLLNTPSSLSSEQDLTEGKTG
ncbi:hypothetical protein ONS95_004450 [Cadophora gregata]|uniref:uncharacterized protein n=1 Tax=Cadophora gregata TaxID=51156 RepID=UPI0026DD4D05|nr:uncharacterized protein ONS95_004450 [Cadophora gregata]KAK0105152.1 hypothetical protein ONS96_004553 [Cadophora gregata f. sp. sojae]KAK0105937.1 hypothetical protein ONS95_004450 [Cadophora gregata]